MNSKYFDLEEFLHSDTAVKNNIENLPTWEGIERLKTLAINYLDPLREAWGSAIYITSGFRNSQLNNKVGGVSNSAHKDYYAVDLQPKDTSISEVTKFYNFIKDYFTKNNIKIDQCFIEKSKTFTWVHLSIDPRMRNMYGEIKKGV